MTLLRNILVFYLLLKKKKKIIFLLPLNLIPKLELRLIANDLLHVAL